MPKLRRKEQVGGQQEATGHGKQRSASDSGLEALRSRLLPLEGLWWPPGRGREGAFNVRIL